MNAKFKLLGMLMTLTSEPDQQASSSKQGQASNSKQGQAANSKQGQASSSKQQQNQNDDDSDWDEYARTSQQTNPQVYTPGGGKRKRGASTGGKRRSVVSNNCASLGTALTRTVKLTT